MRIRTAIFGVYVAASAVGLAVLMRFMLGEVRPRYVTAVRSNLQDTARIVAATLEGRTVEAARKALAGPGSFRARLVAVGGQVLFDSAAAELAERPQVQASTVRRLAHEVGDSVIDGEAPAKAEMEVAVVVPVQLADAAAARLVLARSFRSVNEVIWVERVKLTGMALAVAGLMVIAGWWIAARLTRSIERLTLYAQAVRDGKPAKAPESRAREIAELTRAFEEMRDALEGRQHAERYTQALAHEVKAPLAAIRGAAELLDETMPEEQRRKFLANIRGEAARIQQIVERLLELSSLEARKTLGQTEPLGVAALMAEAAAVVEPAYAAARVTLTVRPAEAALQGERVLLREALVNLLQNALDFSPAGTEVGFVARMADGRVDFLVEDRGPGVPDYALPRVFERFYSLPRPGSGRKSTGIGLALVQEIAHLHGGEVALENRAGGGACATLRLPAVGRG